MKPFSLRNLAASFLPCIDEPAPEATGVPADPAPAVADDPVALRARIAELEENREEEINLAAEQRLYSMLPELEGESGTPASRRDAPRVEQDEPQGADDRIARLESDHARMQAERDADRIIETIEGYREKYPHLDDPQVLSIMARNPNGNVNIEAVCKHSHEYQMARFERYHASKSQNEAEQERIARAWMQKNGIGAQAPPPIPTGAQGATGIEQEKITPKNAASRLAQLARSSGYGAEPSEVGAPRK